MKAMVDLRSLAEALVQSIQFEEDLTGPWGGILVSSENDALNRLQSLGASSLDAQVVLGELYLNAQEHGQGVAYGAVGKTGDAFWAAVTDRGPTIAHTLPRNPQLVGITGKSASAITRLALEEGVTGTGLVGRGIGLSLLWKFVGQGAGPGRAALVISNGCDVFLSASTSTERDRVPSFPGTVVVFTWSE